MDSSVSKLFYRLLSGLKEACHKRLKQPIGVEALGQSMGWGQSKPMVIASHKIVSNSVIDIHAWIRV